jgi:hypothetical protein
MELATPIHISGKISHNMRTPEALYSTRSFAINMWARASPMGAFSRTFD